MRRKWGSDTSTTTTGRQRSVTAPVTVAHQTAYTDAVLITDEDLERATPEAIQQATDNSLALFSAISSGEESDDEEISRPGTPRLEDVKLAQLISNIEEAMADIYVKVSTVLQNDHEHKRKTISFGKRNRSDTGTKFDTFGIFLSQLIAAKDDPKALHSCLSDFIRDNTVAYGALSKPKKELLETIYLVYRNLAHLRIKLKKLNNAKDTIEALRLYTENPLANIPQEIINLAVARVHKVDFDATHDEIETALTQFDTLYARTSDLEMKKDSLSQDIRDYQKNVLNDVSKAKAAATSFTLTYIRLEQEVGMAQCVLAEWLKNKSTPQDRLTEARAELKVAQDNLDAHVKLIATHNRKVTGKLPIKINTKAAETNARLSALQNEYYKLNHDIDKSSDMRDAYARLNLQYVNLKEAVKHLKGRLNKSKRFALDTKSRIGGRQAVAEANDTLAKLHTRANELVRHMQDTTTYITAVCKRQYTSVIGLGKDNWKDLAKELLKHLTSVTTQIDKYSSPFKWQQLHNQTTLDDSSLHRLLKNIDDITEALANLEHIPIAESELISRINRLPTGSRDEMREVHQQLSVLDTRSAGIEHDFNQKYSSIVPALEKAISLKQNPVTCGITFTPPVIDFREFVVKTKDANAMHERSQKLLKQADDRLQGKTFWQRNPNFKKVLIGAGIGLLGAAALTGFGLVVAGVVTGVAAIACTVGAGVAASAAGVTSGSVVSGSDKKTADSTVVIFAGMGATCVRRAAPVVEPVVTQERVSENSSSVDNTLSLDPQAQTQSEPRMLMRESR